MQISNLFVTKKDFTSLAIGSIGFFLGRIVVFEIVSPLALPFLAHFLFNSSKFYWTSFFVLLGFISTYESLYSQKYFVALAILTVCHVLLGKKSKKASPDLQAGFTAAAIFISSMVFVFIKEFSFYFSIVAVFETILTFCFALVLRQGIQVIQSRSKREYLSAEELISIAILFGAVTAGSSGIYIGLFSFYYFFACILMLITCFKGGAALSCMFGLIVGLVLNFSGWQNINATIILAVAGMTGGIFKKFGKVGSAIGFVSGGIVSALYFDRTVLTEELFLSVLIANIVFIIMPDKFYFDINQSLNSNLDNSEVYIEKIKEVTTARLKGFSNSFSRLAKTFDELAEKKTGLTNIAATKLIDDIAATTCTSCSLKRTCWESNFYSTYQSVFSILEVCEYKGFIELKDIPQDFLRICKYSGKFSDAANRVYENYKIDLVWQNRIVESRELVSEQLYGVSKIIENLAYDLDFNINFKQSLEENILEELHKNKIEVESILVLENRLGKYEVTLTTKPCFGKRKCDKDVIPIISKMLSKKMKRDSSECIISNEGKKGICQVRLVEEQKFRIVSGIAKANKSNGKESGDSHSFMELKNGQCLMALSDGMGSGMKAREESAATVELLEEFIESGFEKDVAIKMINSVLVLKSNDDSFSTLDICSVDLYTGAAEFVKIGASSTFLIRGNEVSIIRSSSLPVGILNTVDVEVTRKNLKNSDIILMITDGISDLHEGFSEAWIAEAIRGLKSRNPQDIADYILSEAKKLSKDHVRDDMTILAARVWQR